MAQRQSQGLGGSTLKSTNDISGQVTAVTNGNTVGSPNANAVGLTAMLDTSNDDSFVINTTGRTQWSLGVIEDTPKAGDPGKISTVNGTITKVWTGGAITRGDKLVPDTSGRAVTMTTTPAYTFAIALETAAGAGVLISAMLYHIYVPTTP